VALETGVYISDLVVTNPLNGDQKAQGAGHLRLLKATIKTTFPNVTGAVNPTQTELNYVVGTTSAIQTQIANEIARATAAEALKANTASPTFTGSVVIPAGATIAGFAPLASPVLTGTPTAPTALAGTNSTQLATTAFVNTTSFSAALPLQTGNAGKFVTTDGTNASWVSPAVTLGANTFTGAQDWATGAPIASASTINLDASTGNRNHITGTTPINNVTLTRGPRLVVFDGILTLNYNAVTNRLTGGGNITTAVGDICEFHSDGTTTYGVYTRADGTAITGYINPLLGAAGTATVIEAVASTNFIAVCALSSTRAMGIYKNASSFPKAVLLDNTGAVVASAIIENVAVALTPPQIISLTTTTALAIYGLGTPSLRAVVLTDNGASVGIGSPVTIVGAAATQQCLIFLTASKAIAAYDNTGTKATILGISGTTITVNTIYSVSATSPTAFIRGAAISSTQAVLSFATAGSAGISVQVLTESSNVITFNTELQFSTIGNTNVGDVVPISSNRVGMIFNSTGTYSYSGAAVTFDVAGTGSSANLQLGKFSTIIFNDGSPRPIRGLKLSSNTLLFNNVSFPGGTTLQTLAIRGPSLETGSSANITRATGVNDLCVMGASTLLTFYVDSTNSNYPTSRVMALGTVT
jgi:hypothetical protein